MGMGHKINETRWRAVKPVDWETNEDLSGGVDSIRDRMLNTRAATSEFGVPIIVPSHVIIVPPPVKDMLVVDIVPPEDALNREPRSARSDRAGYKNPPEPLCCLFLRDMGSPFSFCKSPNPHQIRKFCLCHPSLAQCKYQTSLELICERSDWATIVSKVQNAGTQRQAVKRQVVW